MAEQGQFTATNLPADGTTIEAADVNTSLQGLIDEFNKLVGSSKLADAAVTGSILSTSAITIGYAEVTTGQTPITTEADLTNLAVTVTVPAGGRRIRITGCVITASTVADDQNGLYIKEGATYLQKAYCNLSKAGQGQTLIAQYVVAPTAGSHTYKLALHQSAGTGNASTAAAATYPSFILVELI